jgi:protein-disulfide isomerase
VAAVPSKYGDKVRFVHQDFPLDNHPRAFYASRASRCANDQGKYWEFHRDMLKRPTDFSDTDLQGRAERLKLDMTAFNACVASNRHDESIRSTQKAGQDLGVTGTPTFFINGRVLFGARSREQFEEIIDQELTRTASN